MLTPVYCNGCGQRLEVPAGYARGKLRCEDCGVFTDLPKEIREQGQTARPESPARTKPAPARPTRSEMPPPADDHEEAYTFLESTDADPPASRSSAPLAARPTEDDVPEREVLIQGTQEDDFNPYTVTGDAPTKRCPDCDKKIEVRAKLCAHCGYNFDTGEKAKRSFKPIDRSWENGWPWERRLMLFMGLQVINFVTLAATLIGGQAGVGFPLILLTVGLQAFLCGTYDKLVLTRTQRGKVTLSTIWRFAFVPRPPQPHKWKEHESVIVIQSNEFDVIDWIMALILVSWCIVPGVLFWWFVIRPDKYTVYLCRDHGFPETAIFRTSSQERANEILQVVSDVTTLPIHR